MEKGGTSQPGVVAPIEPNTVVLSVRGTTRGGGPGSPVTAAMGPVKVQGPQRQPAPLKLIHTENCPPPIGAPSGNGDGGGDGNPTSTQSPLRLLRLDTQRLRRLSWGGGFTVTCAPTSGVASAGAAAANMPEAAIAITPAKQLILTSRRDFIATPEPRTP